MGSQTLGTSWHTSLLSQGFQDCPAALPGSLLPIHSRRAACLKTQLAMAKSANKAGPAKRRKKMDTSSFKTYIARVLRQVHPKVRISQKSMSILNSLVQDTFDKVASEGGRLCKLNKKHTLTSREIQTAIRLVFPGELAKHAVSEGTKAVTKFSNA